MPCFPRTRETWHVRETCHVSLVGGKHVNINADHMVLIEQRDWSVSYANVTKLRHCIGNK